MSESTSFVRLFVGFLLNVAGTYASCPIEVNPTSVVLKYGDPISINCSTSETKFEGIGWEASKNGTGLQKVTHMTWSVDHLTEWSTSPSCFINPEKGGHFKQCAIGPKIVVYTFPEDISISSNDRRDGVMKEGKTYNFTCDVPDIAPVQNLTVRWYKGDELLNTTAPLLSSDEPVNHSSILNFIPTRLDNGATFRCEAHLDLGPELHLNVSSQEYNITVYFGPDVQCSTTELFEKDTLENACWVTGNPQPFVKWLKNGTRTDPAAPLSRESAGTYEIEAEGSSYIKKEIQVHILYGPELTCPSNYIAQEYDHNNLSCEIKGYPQPEIIWYKDGEEVDRPDQLTRKDAGQYIITASNKRSNVNRSVDITVLYPPSPIVELEDAEVEVGSTVWLKCSSVGNPRPQYSWDYYQSDNVMKENEDGVSLLTIHNATVYNMGSYTCHAKNDVGNVLKTVKVTVKGAKSDCPVEIFPDRMVVAYQGRSQNAECKPKSRFLNNVNDVFWQDRHKIRTNGSFSVDTKDWDLTVECIGFFQGIGRCSKQLDITLYKTPDSVSIFTVGNTSAVVEGREIQLQCDITNVAPAGKLAVHWYLGNRTITSPKDSLRLTGCVPDNNTDCSIGVIRSPLNVSSTISITLNRTHTGAELRCEAVLDLGPVGPEPPNTKSNPINVTVYYKPVINTSKLAKTIPVFSGYPEDLVCEADGHPPPVIVWWSYSSEKAPRVFGENLTVSEAGIYNCTASNDVDSVFYEVEVILKEDYLPLIAGFVAVTVVAISVIFLFIYSIYYKNTKMRRYSLKNPNFSTHNSNVAHNGWDLQFPMTKLS